MDAAILRTLSRIQKKDPEIYDAEKGVFEGTSANVLCRRGKVKKCVPMFRGDEKNRSFDTMGVQG